jgi:hypothetical protein
MGSAWRSPPCRAFSPTLSSFAAQHPRADEFTVLFVSADHSEQAMKAFAKGKCFTSVRFDAAARRRISSEMGVSMYPSLYVINPQTGETLTKWGRSLLLRDGSMEGWLRGESGESKYVKMLAVALVFFCLLVLRLLGFV